MSTEPIMRPVVFVTMVAMAQSCARTSPSSPETASATTTPSAVAPVPEAGSQSLETGSASSTDVAVEARSSTSEGRSMGHQTKHGGVLIMAVVNGVHLHVEAVAAPNGRVSLWATDAGGAAVRPNDVTGSVTCEREDTHAKSTAAVKAIPSTGAVEANCPAFTAPATSVTYDLVVRGTPVTATIHVSPKGTSGHVHTH
jgi:hypothetical protein